jgi:hypothetical protein
MEQESSGSLPVSGFKKSAMPMTHADSMFSLFKSRTVLDPVLGELRRSGGAWRGRLSVGGAPAVALVLPGDGNEPDPRAIEVVRELDARLPDWRAGIAAALLDHLEPYADADTGSFGHIRTPEDVWPHARLCHVNVFEQSGVLTLELGYGVDWDEDHILGARFQQGRLVELNGSTGPL